MLRLAIVALVFVWSLVSSAGAQPARYELDPEGSSVSFTYRMMNTPASGTMPVSSADLTLDFQNLSRSRATVTLDITGTKTGNPFVTDALAGPLILDAARFPHIRFSSKSVSGTVDSAHIRGDVTLHGVTRPMVLQAQVFRRDGSDPGDLSRLTVLLTGHINRSEFGASGYADMVADRVDLKIVARLRRR